MTAIIRAGGHWIYSQFLEQLVRSLKRFVEPFISFELKFIQDFPPNVFENPARRNGWAQDSPTTFPANRQESRGLERVACRQLNKTAVLKIKFSISTNGIDENLKNICDCVFLALVVYNKNRFFESTTSSG